MNIKNQMETTPAQKLSAAADAAPGLKPQPDGSNEGCQPVPGLTHAKTPQAAKPVRPTRPPPKPASARKEPASAPAASQSHLAITAGLAQNEAKNCHSQPQDVAEINSTVPTLSQAESSKLKDYEQRINKGIRTFYEVGSALSAICDEKLYRADYKKFEDYLEKRWHISRPRGYQLISAAKVVSALSNLVDKRIDDTLITEQQAKAMVGLDNKQIIEVWTTASEVAGAKPPTAARIKSIRNQKFPKLSPAGRVAEGADDNGGTNAEPAKTRKSKPDPRKGNPNILIPLPQIKKLADRIYSIYENPTKRQDGLNLFEQLLRTLATWEDAFYSNTYATTILNGMFLTVTEPELRQQFLCSVQEWVDKNTED